MTIKKIKAGDVYPTNEGGSVTVYEYINASRVSIYHNDENKHFAHVTAKNLRVGQVKNPYHRSVHGVGYVGVGRYKSRVNYKQAEAYDVWSGMLRRCYCSKSLSKQPSYAGCSVHPDWHNFQVFAKWFESQNKGVGYHIDKDLIDPKKREYGPDFSVLIPSEINTLIYYSRPINYDLPVGVSKRGNRYRASITISGKNKDLGCFDTKEEAFSTYKAAREMHVKRMANLYKSVIDPRVYRALMLYTVKMSG